MKKKSRESLRDIANRIPKQSLCEIETSLRSLLDEWTIIFSDGCLSFPMDEAPDLVIPLTTIYGTLKTRDAFYIICHNRVLHHFDHIRHLHQVTFLDDTQDDIL